MRVYTINSNTYKSLHFLRKHFVFFSLLFVSSGFLLQHIGLIIPDKYLNAPENAWNVVGIMESWLHVSYFEFGFIRRAAIGTILAPFSKEISRVLYFFISVFCVLLLIYVFRRIVKHDRLSKKLSCIMILSPAFFLNVGWNFGRFDFVNFAILYFALVNAKRRNYLAPSLLSSLAICIHEAFLFYGIPLIAASIVKYADGKPMRRFLKFAFLPVFVSIYLFLYGSSTDVNTLAANRPLIQYQGFDLLNYSVSIYYVLFSSLMYIKLIKRRLDILSISPFLTFVLFILGVDYMRWVTLFLISCFMSIVIRDDLSDKLDGSIGFFTIALILPLPLGPLGVVTPFPAFEDFLMLIEKVGIG